MSLYQLLDKRPQIHPSAWVAENCVVIGDVRIGAECGIWWNTVIRGDNDTIMIGDGCNIQDSSVMHTDAGIVLDIGRRVTVGHRVILHGCTVGEGSLIGMGAVLMDHSKIGRHCLVGANTLIPERKVYPDRSLILGSPGKVVRELTDAEVAMIDHSAQHYIEGRLKFMNNLTRIPT